MPSTQPAAHTSPEDVGSLNQKHLEGSKKVTSFVLKATQTINSKSPGGGITDDFYAFPYFSFFANLMCVSSRVRENLYLKSTPKSSVRYITVHGDISCCAHLILSPLGEVVVQPC